MKPYVKSDERIAFALCSSAFPTPLEENATESAFLSAVPRILCRFSVCFLLAFFLFTLAANFPVIARIVASS